MTRLAISLLLLFWPLAADFMPSAWQFRRPLPIGSAPGWYVFRIDTDLYKASHSDLADLRIVRDGEEVPYVIETLSGAVELRELVPQVLDRSFRPGAGVEITLDLGKPIRHNRLRIASRESDFRQNVIVETADILGRWALARKDGYIFDYSKGDWHAASLTVGYPLSTRRYVRATFAGWTDPNSISGAWLAYAEVSPEVVSTLAVVAPKRTEDPKTRATILDLDLGAPNIPHDRARLEIGAESFHRMVQIESSANSKEWHHVGVDTVYRVPGEDSVTVRFPRRDQRYLRLRILNQDDQPLPVGRVHIQHTAQEVRFQAVKPGAYWVYCSNSNATRPSYDLAAVIKRTPTLPPAASIIPSALEHNPAYHPPVLPPKPWTERHPTLLYGILSIAVLALGYLSVRFLLKVQSTSSPNPPPG